MRAAGKVVFVAPLGKGASVGDDFDERTYGEAVDFLVETEDGRLFAFCDDEAQITQINYNPFTGEPAKVMIESHLHEEPVLKEKP